MADSRYTLITELSKKENLARRTAKQGLVALELRLTEIVLDFSYANPFHEISIIISTRLVLVDSKFRLVVCTEPSFTSKKQVEVSFVLSILGPTIL